MPDNEWEAAMRRGDIATALRIGDAALAARDPLTRDDPALPYHLRWVWDGRPVAGRRVLVRCYHGLGDTLQFSRLLAPLRRIAARVTVEFPAPLLPLLGGLADAAVAFDPANPLPPDEVDVEIMELGHALRLDVAAVPPPSLTVEPLGKRRDRAVLAGGRLGRSTLGAAARPARRVAWRASGQPATRTGGDGGGRGVRQPLRYGH